MKYKPRHDKPTKTSIDKYLLILDWAKKNDYHITINKQQTTNKTIMETTNKDNNNGFLFKNENKKTENHADYTGKVVINNNEHYLSAWVNTSKSGMKYLKVKIGNKTDVKQEVKPMVKNEPEDLF